MEFHIRQIIIPAILVLTGLMGAALIPPALADTAASPGQTLSATERQLLKTVRSCMDETDYTGAIAAIRAAAPGAANPPGPAACGHPLVCLALGNSHLMLSDYPNAESAYLAALDMDPGFLDARVNLAKVYTDSGQYAKAAEAFFKAYACSGSKNPDFLYYGAVMHLTAGQAGPAIHRFDTLFAAHPDRVTRQWKENFANALMMDRRWQRAVPLVRDLASQTRGKERIKWQETLLQIYLTTHDTEQARAYATALSREAPARAAWWKALVHIHLSLGRYENALADLIIYGFLTPLTREEKKLLADLSLQVEVPARAAKMYESLLGDAPSDQKTGLLLHLANALRQAGRPEKALALLERFDAIASDPDLLILKGDLLYEAKAYEAADDAFRLAARGNSPRKGQAWLMAGYAAWQYNDLEASRQAFEKAARFKGFRRDALAAIEQLERTRQM